MPKIVFLHGLYLALRSRSKVGVKVKSWGQGHRSNVWRAAVDIRGSALPSAAKSNKSHYQSRVFVCVSVIGRHIGIIARMRSIGVLIFFQSKLVWSPSPSAIFTEKIYSVKYISSFVVDYRYIAPTWKMAPILHKTIYNDVLLTFDLYLPLCRLWLATE